MGFTGEENRKEQDYIFDTIPYNPEFDLEQLKQIEYKLINYTSGSSFEGLEPEEAEVFLDWITFNARNYAVSNNENMNKEDELRKNFSLSSMTGQCGPTQRINVQLLNRFGLDPKPINMVDCIGSIDELPKSNETEIRMADGWDSPAIWHAVTTVNIPISIDGYTQEYTYLLDPTFRQFCLEENCNTNCYKEAGHTVAPHPGYFMKASNLMELGVSQEKAQRSETLGRHIIEKGYFFVDGYSKEYIQAFRRAAINREFQEDYERLYSITEQESAWNLKNSKGNIVIVNRGSEENFLKLPTEKGEKQGTKENIFAKIKNIFNKIFNKNDIQALPEAKINIPTKNPYEEFRKQYEFNGEVENINNGQVEQLNKIVKNNEINYENEI